jgi:ATP-binding cassette, subfamily F, member 3
MSSFVEQAVSTILASIDEDTREYIASMIADADDMEETREAVDAMIEGADEDNAEELQKKLWAAIESSGEQTQQTSSDDAGEVTKLLEKKITIGDSDVQTFASGMKAQGGDDDARGMDFSTFFANQIGIRTEAAMSEKKRRKLAQRKLREEAERREREIELENQMSLAATGDASADDAAGYNDSVDNAQDCHLVNFNLPNKKGSGTDLLSNVNLTLARGRRYGLVGRNGCGKTTLMEMISQRQVPGVPKNLSLLLVKQEIMGSDRTALETVIRSDTRREGLLAYIKKTEEEDDKAEGLAKAYERLSIMEEESGPSEPRARKVLSGLGFKEEMMVKPTSKLSGGWRMRVSLACALFASPNLLLLDEPTNHLDLEAVLWLERYLNKTFKGTLLIVSHDRHFLNEVVTDVLHFHRETLTCYKGDINTFEETREERRKNQIRLRDEQEAKRKHMQSYIDKHAEAGSNGPSAARQRKSRMKKMERIGMQGAAQGKKYKISYEGAVEDVEEYVEDEDVTLDFPDPGSFDSNIVELDRVTFGYEGAELLMKSVDLVVDNKSRVALLGRNGCGKR